MHSRHRARRQGQGHGCIPQRTFRRRQQLPDDLADVARGVARDLAEGVPLG